MKTLQTGQKLIITQDKSFPRSSVYVIFKSGAILEPKSLEGVTALMGEMLTRGTTHRTRDVIRDELDQLGAEIDVDVDREHMMIRGETLTRNFDAFMDIFTDVIFHPSFDDKELEKLKRETISGLHQMRENDQQWVGRFFKRALFQDHPYGFSLEGRESTIQKATQQKVREFYKDLLTRDNVFYAATGDLDPETIRQKFNSSFQSMPEGKTPTFNYPKLPVLTGKTVVLIDKPDRTQTQILIGHIGIDVHHPDFFPIMIANNAFGGGMTARLMDEVRVKRGWSYGAYSWFRARKKPGEFAMLAFPATKDTPDTLKLMLSLYEDYAARGLSQDEFERSKSNLINEFAFKIDTPRKKVGQLITIELMDLPKDYLETYQDKLRSVTLKQVNEVIQKHADPKNLVIAILCTAKDIKPKLKEVDPKFKIKVVSYKED